MFDRFDIVEAWYWWLTDHHMGQNSESYAKLSTISKYFRPGAGSYGPSTEHACEIYNNICARDDCDHERLSIDDRP